MQAVTSPVQDPALPELLAPPLLVLPLLLVFPPLDAPLDEPLEPDDEELEPLSSLLEHASVRSGTSARSETKDKGRTGSFME